MRSSQIGAALLHHAVAQPQKHIVEVVVLSIYPLEGRQAGAFAAEIRIVC